MSDLGDWDSRIMRSITLFGLDIFGHRRFIKQELYPGVMHFMLLWGAIILLIATSLGAIEANWHKFIASGAGFEFPTSYIRVQTSLIWDMGGVMFLMGVGMAVYRRVILRPDRINNLFEDLWFLGLLSSLAVTGFLVEGLRIGATNPSMPWAEPVGNLVALMYGAVGMTTYGMEVTHFVLYWLHVGTWTSILVLGAVKFSKFSQYLSLQSMRSCGQTALSVHFALWKTWKF